MKNPLKNKLEKLSKQARNSGESEFKILTEFLSDAEQSNRNQSKELLIAICDQFIGCAQYIKKELSMPNKVMTKKDVQKDFTVLINSCVEGYIGEWNTTGEGLDGFLAMKEILERLAKHFKVDVSSARGKGCTC